MLAQAPPHAFRPPRRSRAPKRVAAHRKPVDRTIECAQAQDASESSQPETAAPPGPPPRSRASAPAAAAFVTPPRPGATRIFVGNRLLPIYPPRLKAGARTRIGSFMRNRPCQPAARDARCGRTRGPRGRAAGVDGRARPPRVGGGACTRQRARACVHIRAHADAFGARVSVCGRFGVWVSVSLGQNPSSVSLGLGSLESETARPAMDRQLHAVSVRTLIARCALAAASSRPSPPPPALPAAAPSPPPRRSNLPSARPRSSPRSIAANSPGPNTQHSSSPPLPAAPAPSSAPPAPGGHALPSSLHRLAAPPLLESSSSSPQAAATAVAGAAAGGAEAYRAARTRNSSGRRSTRSGRRARRRAGKSRAPARSESHACARARARAREKARGDVHTAGNGLALMIFKTGGYSARKIHRSPRVCTVRCSARSCRACTRARTPGVSALGKKTPARTQHDRYVPAAPC